MHGLLRISKDIYVVVEYKYQYWLAIKYLYVYDGVYH